MLQATKIIAEKFIGGNDLPTEYNFHVVNGTVAAIDIVHGRGTACPCYAVVDTDWMRLDQFGCFEASGMEFVDTDGCTRIDFAAGRLKYGPIKNNLYICENIPVLCDCLSQEMIQIALSLGDAIGVYIMRVDMFVSNNMVYVQEYSPNHMNGMHHCAARMDGACIVSCFIGRLWSNAGAPYGGVPTPVPTTLAGFLDLSAQEQCDLLIDVQVPTHHTSACG
jgi:hypothetical protein